MLKKKFQKVLKRSRCLKKSSKWFKKSKKIKSTQSNFKKKIESEKFNSNEVIVVFRTFFRFRTFSNNVTNRVDNEIWLTNEQ